MPKGGLEEGDYRMNLRNIGFGLLLAVCVTGTSGAPAQEEKTVRDFLAKCAKNSHECSVDVLDYLAAFMTPPSGEGMHGGTDPNSRAGHPLVQGASRDARYGFIRGTAKGLRDTVSVSQTIGCYMPNGS